MPRTGGPEPELVFARLKAGAAPRSVLSPAYQAWRTQTRFAAHHNQVASRLKGLHSSLNEYRDTPIRLGGQTINVLARQRADGLVVGDAQWTVTIAGKKPTIAGGYAAFTSIDAFTELVISNYDATAGWTASSDASDHDMVVLDLELDNSLTILNSTIAVINVSTSPDYELYTVVTGTPDYIQHMRIPIALIKVTGSGPSSVVTVKAQFITTPIRLHQARWGAYLGFTTV